MYRKRLHILNDTRSNEYEMVQHRQKPKDEVIEYPLGLETFSMPRQPFTSRIGYFETPKINTQYSRLPVASSTSSRTKTAQRWVLSALLCTLIFLLCR